jgi:hypothetical protein
LIRVSPRPPHNEPLQLSMVEEISPSDAGIFPEYILPHLRHFVVDPEVLVRVAYAKCIGMLAETALRFLEMAQVVSDVDRLERNFLN